MGDNTGISEPPVNILFNPSAIVKKDAWEIDLVYILDLLTRILEESGRKDLNLAGMAALTSSLIYRMKVESVFALQKTAMEKKPPSSRPDHVIEVIRMPYRRESTYPVTLDELLVILENLIGSIANPKRRQGRARHEFHEEPNIQEYLTPSEGFTERHHDHIMRKLRSAGSCLLSWIVSGLNPIESIQCFFALLTMARDEEVMISQEDDEIRVTLVMDPPSREN